MGTKTILILDDQPEVLLLLKNTMDRMGYNCLICDRVNDAINIVENFNLHAIVVDLNLAPSDCSGIEFANTIRQMGYSGKIAIISGYLPINVPESYYETVDVVMEKPFRITDLITWLNSF